MRLPPTALLGSIKKPADSRGAFFSKIYRVAIGTIALSSLGIPSLQIASYIASRYSQRRHVIDAGGISKPIISFQTQKQPILTAVAQSFVLQEMHKEAVVLFMNPALDPRVRHAIATVHKVAMIQAAQAANFTLGDRCGAQGLFEANQLSAMHVRYLSLRLRSTLLTPVFIRRPTCVGSQSPRETCWEFLSVRLSVTSQLAFLMPFHRAIGLTSELLLGRYEFEPSRYPNSLLAQHEKGLFSELRAALAKAGSHRSSAYDREILPRSLSFIQAIGHRLSYDAARTAAIDTPLLDLFEIASVLQDEAWYVECLGMARSELRKREEYALEAVFPRLEEYLARMDVAPYVFAPISSDERWKLFVDTLQTFGAASSELGAGIVGALLYDDDSSMQVQMVPHRPVRSML